MFRLGVPRCSEMSRCNVVWLRNFFFLESICPILEIAIYAFITESVADQSLFG